MDGVIRQSRRAAPLGGVVAKASAGAVAHVKVADVVNIARAVEELKEAGVWTIGLAGDADKRYDEIDFSLPSALVLGAEGDGLRRLVRERCDWLVSIPMRGQIDSLNVSVAAGVVLFEAVRQRTARGRLDMAIQPFCGKLESCPWCRGVPEWPAGMDGARVMILALAARASSSGIRDTECCGMV